ncbi:hypothetical protein H9P43_004336 [Blastocladiella emersonii ATCC 22665]|nr:hypothetical protein H9P43_004336 [Blastocladiella emersonii ATCC 22665]
MATDNGDWTLIESDPGVFTELIRSFGVQGLEVEEVYDLESFQFMGDGDVYGFIFLFKYDPAIIRADTRAATQWTDVPDVFFAQQVIQNACATQAILSVLLNSPEAVSLGEELAQFKQFTGSFDPEIKGLSITNSETMRRAHNSFARADPFVNEIAPVRDEDKEDNFHFVAYVPSATHSAIFELDGLKPGPLRVADLPITPAPSSRDWIAQLVPVIQSRIAAFAESGEIRFNLLAVTQSKSALLERQIAGIEEQLRTLDLGGEDVRAELERERSRVKEQLDSERAKMDRYKRENARRRHNYLPLILELLNQMAAKGTLTSATDKAKEAKRAAMAKAAKEGKAGKH